MNIIKISNIVGTSLKNLKNLEKPLEKYKKGLFNKKKYDSAKAEYMDVSKELVDDNKDIVRHKLVSKIVKSYNNT